MYTKAYGKIIRLLTTALIVHVAFWGSPLCSFIQASDQDGDEGTINYYTSPTFSVLATPFEINGITQHWQCVYPYRTDGTPRTDFWCRSFVLNEVFAIFSSPFNNVQFLIIDGYYGNQNRYLDIGGSASTSRVRGQGLVSFDDYGFRGGGNKDFYIENLILKNYVSRFSRTNIYAFNSIFCDTITTESSSGDLAGFRSIGSIVKNTDLNHSGNGQSSGRFSSDCIWLSYNTQGAHLWRTESSSRNYIKESNFSSLNGLNYSNNQSAATSTGVGNINQPPLFNSGLLNDFTLLISSTHFRNGGVNQSANIGNARYGLPCYRGDAPFDTGVVSDVVTVDQLLSWTESNDVFYGSKTINNVIGIECIKWIGAEEITTNFGAPDVNNVLASASFPVDESQEANTPVVYIRVTLNGDVNETITADNDLPATIEGVDTTNFFSYDLSTGARYLESKIWIDGIGTIKYTEPNPESREPSNITGLTDTTLSEVIRSKWIKKTSMVVEMLVIYKNNVEVDLFRGVTIVPKQFTLLRKTGSNDQATASSWNDNSIVIDDGIESIALNESDLRLFDTNVSIPFGYSNQIKVALDGSFTKDGQTVIYNKTLTLE